jgi:hypothetical protein
MVEVAHDRSANCRGDLFNIDSEKAPKKGCGAASATGGYLQPGNGMKKALDRDRLSPGKLSMIGEAQFIDPARVRAEPRPGQRCMSAADGARARDGEFTA